MRILILNWKDIKHPNAGGAEIVTHELAKRWVQQGHQITLCTPLFPNASKEELLDGVNIIRRGKQGATHLFWALWLYRTRFKKRFDIIIDQIHGVPFFTKLYVREPQVALIFEVAKDKWNLEFTFPLNIIGYLAERASLCLYRSVPFLTSSHSTREDLEKAGIRNILVFPLGTSIYSPSNTTNREKAPTFISLGRLLPGKQVEQTIRAFSVPGRENTAKLWVVGKGKKKYTEKLKTLAKKLGLDNTVKFWGYVSEKEKKKLLQRSWAIISTSAREGWGLNIIEAGTLGTPAIVYNSPGLRDAVRHGETGLICESSTPEELAKQLEKLMKTPKLREKLGKQAQELNQKLTWDKSAKIVLDAIKSIIIQRSNN